MGEKLRRSREDRVFLGILGGLAREFGLDPTLLRIIFVVLLALNPVLMTLLYFLGALLIPESDEERDMTPAERIERLVDETGKRLSDALSGKERSNTPQLFLLIAFALLFVGWVPELVFPFPFGIRAMALTLMILALVLSQSPSKARSGG